MTKPVQTWHGYLFSAITRQTRKPKSINPTTIYIVSLKGAVLRGFLHAPCSLSYTPRARSLTRPMLALLHAPCSLSYTLHARSLTRPMLALLHAPCSLSYTPHAHSLTRPHARSLARTVLALLHAHMLALLHAPCYFGGEFSYTPHAGVGEWGGGGGAEGVIRGSTRSQSELGLQRKLLK